MKVFGKFGDYIKIFVLSVLIIAVYKTFDNIGFLMMAFRDFLKILYPVFVAFAIAFLLYPICRRLEGLYSKCKLKIIHNKRRILSVLTVILAALALVAAAVSFLVPAVIKSAKDLISQVPAIYEYMVGVIRNLGFDFDSSSIMNYISMDKILEVLDFSNANKYIQRVAGAGSVLFDLLMSVVIAIYILTDRNALRIGSKRVFSLFVKKETRQLVMPYLSLTCGYMYKYFGCLLLDAMVVFLLSLSVMLVIGVKYAPLLALMMGLFNIIPYFGAIISVVLIVIITLVTGSLSQAVITAISLIVLQQIDANVIQPYIVKDSLQIKPFWVLVAILLGGGLFGFVGVIIAVPIMAMLLTVAGDIMDARERKFDNANNSEC